MKKLLSIVAVAMLMGAVCSRAAPVLVTNVLAQADFTLKAKLSDGTKVTGADLAGTGDLAWLGLQVISGDTTNGTWVVAKSVAVTNNVLTDALVLLEETSYVGLPKEKLAAVLADTGADTNIDGAVWFVTATWKVDTRTGKPRVTGKVVGIWKDGATSFSGSVGRVK